MGTKSIHRTLKWIGGALLVLIVLAALGNALPKSPSSPTTSNSSVVVAKPVVVSVVKSGFTQNTENAGDLISYGLILRNNNSTLTALDVKVTTTFLDSLGRSVGTDDQTITGIPPAGNFNVGGSIAPNISLTVARLRVAVKVGGSTTVRLVLPLVTNVTAKPQIPGISSVTGSLRNLYPRLLPSDATIYIVYMNAHGRVMGGDNEPTGAAVSPGATVSFSDTLLSKTISKTTIVRASVDPDGYPVPGSGTIRWTTP